MASVENIRGELQMGLKLLAFKSLTLDLAPLAAVAVTDAMKAENWEPISAFTEDASGKEFHRYFYGTAQKTYAHVCCNGATGACEIKSAEEADILETLSFDELKHLGNLIDKKSVAFIRIYSEKEMASAKTDEERKALNERNEKMIAEAEVALRKR